MTQITPFGLLLGELRGCLEPAQFERVRLVLSSWGGQQIPAATRWRIDAAVIAAHRMAQQGTPRPVMRDRLMSMGVSRPTAYRIISKVKETAHAAV